MILSNNNNGKVYKTSNTGYSVKSAAKKLIEFAKSVDSDCEYNVANTGSTYVNFEFNEVYYTIRVANHSKRVGFGFDLEVNKNVVVPENLCCSFDILNTETKNSFFAHLGI
jgi:hypothetical protein